MIIQLNPPLPVITPKGKALAHFLIDEGIEHDLKWVCFIDSTGEFWTYRNQMIRAQKNITQDREYISPFYNPDDVSIKDFLSAHTQRMEEKKAINEAVNDESSASIDQMLSENYSLKERIAFLESAQLSPSHLEPTETNNSSQAAKQGWAKHPQRQLKIEGKDGELLRIAAENIAKNHRQIIDDWCKAYCAELYEENGSIKPGDFVLVEQIDLVLENGKMGKKYWFESKDERTKR